MGTSKFPGCCRGWYTSVGSIPRRGVIASGITTFFFFTVAARLQSILPYNHKNVSSLIMYQRHVYTAGHQAEGGGRHPRSQRSANILSIMYQRSADVGLMRWFATDRMKGVNIRGSSNKALAFWYDVYMGYESMIHWGEGGCAPPYPLPITPPLPTPCSLSYFIVFKLI